MPNYQNYTLYLFDFDGLLVNTEELHFKAYQTMMAKNGFKLDWSFDRYCQTAHYEASGLREQIYHEFPKLKEKEPNWQVLYAEKQASLVRLLEEGQVQLMPGVEQILKDLQAANIARCVVTHSPDQIVSVARKLHPILNSIPNWITREHYEHPKPHPECYLKAIEKLGTPGGKTVGFEDTPRGLTALMGTDAQAVLICKAHYPEIPLFKTKGAKHFASFLEYLKLA